MAGETEIVRGESRSGDRIIYDLVAAIPGKLVPYQQIWERLELAGAYRARNGGEKVRKGWFDQQVFKLNQSLAASDELPVIAVNRLGLVMGSLNWEYFPQMRDNLSTGDEYGGQVLVGYKGLVRLSEQDRRVIEKLRARENQLIWESMLTIQERFSAGKLAEAIGSPGKEPGWQIRVKKIRANKAGYAWVNLDTTEGKPAWESGFEKFDGQRNFWVVSAAGKVVELTGNEAFLLGLLVKERGAMLDKRKLIERMVEAGCINSQNEMQGLVTAWWQLKELERGYTGQERFRSTGRGNHKEGEQYGLF